MDLKNFIGRQQLAVIRQACNGEEGAFFRKLMADLEERIATMPKTYETDGMPGKDIATLHYFKGGSNWNERKKERWRLRSRSCANWVDAGSSS